MSEDISNGSYSILKSLEQTSVASETVALTAQNSAKNTEGILTSIDMTTKSIGDASASLKNQSILVDELNQLIQKFNL
jgi:methyl-accepting chemotaxis protein